jgi:hypothetical protein
LRKPWRPQLITRTFGWLQEKRCIVKRVDKLATG